MTRETDPVGDRAEHEPDTAEVFGDEAEPADADGAEKEAVRKEADSLRDWVKELTGDDIKSGNWFEKLVAHALHTYTKTVSYEWFQTKYHGSPPDLIVDQRIKSAERYAALEGATTASAYSAAVAAAVAGLGGPAPIALPAAGVTFFVDMAFVTQLQLRLAYDISVLYRVPVDIDDPDDMWDLVRVAFAIKGGEVVSEGLIKLAPLFVRPLVKKIFTGGTLATLKSLPVVGKHLLQRNIIKFGIPLVGIPLATGLNFWTTRVAGRFAKNVFRNSARIIELAVRLSEKTEHPKLLLWVAWMIIQADAKVADDEAFLMRQLLRAVRERHDVDDDELATVIDVDWDDLWARLESESGDLTSLVDAARAVASVDGSIAKAELALLDQLEARLLSRPA